MGITGSQKQAAQSQVQSQVQSQAQPQEAAAAPAAVNAKSAPVKPSAWKSFTAKVGGAMATVGTGISTAATWLASTYTGWGIIALALVAVIYVAYNWLNEDSSKASKSSTKPMKSRDLNKDAPRLKAAKTMKINLLKNLIWPHAYNLDRLLTV